jgi:hypothetical protein
VCAGRGAARGAARARGGSAVRAGSCARAAHGGGGDPPWPSVQAGAAGPARLVGRPRPGRLGDALETLGPPPAPPAAGPGRTAVALARFWNSHVAMLAFMPPPSGCVDGARRKHGSSAGGWGAVLGPALAAAHTASSTRRPARPAPGGAPGAAPPRARRAPRRAARLTAWSTVSSRAPVPYSLIDTLESASVRSGAHIGGRAAGRLSASIGGGTVVYSARDWPAAGRGAAAERSSSRRTPSGAAGRGMAPRCAGGASLVRRLAPRRHANWRALKAR